MLRQNQVLMQSMVNRMEREERARGRKGGEARSKTCVLGKVVERKLGLGDHR